MIDPSIITNMAQQNQPLASLADGIKMGRALRGLFAEHQIGKMNQLATPEEKQAFASRGLFSRELTEALKLQTVEAEKAALDKQKSLADIGKITADTQKINADSTATNQKTLIDRNRAATSAIAAAMSGNPSAASFILDHSKAGGILDDASYEQAKGFLSANAGNPEAISSLVKSLGIAAAEKPEQYIQPDANNLNTNATSAANNAADNATSRANNAATVAASRYSTDVGAETADKNRTQQQGQFDANLYVQQNKPLDYFTAADGTRYAVYANGQGIPVSGPTGAPVKAIPTGKSVETPVQRMERVEKVQDFATVSQTAADGAKLAESLGKNIQALNKTAGGFGLTARIPGTDAKAFATQLETMKSQVFLNQIARMKGSGALSDAEGKKLDSALASLDLGLSPADLQANLFEISRILAGVADGSRNKARIYAGKEPVTPASPGATNTGNKPSAKSFFE